MGSHGVEVEMKAFGDVSPYSPGVMGQKYLRGCCAFPGGLDIQAQAGDLLSVFRGIFHKLITV
jgi:hypothetical protein